MRKHLVIGAAFAGAALTAALACYALLYTLPGRHVMEAAGFMRQAASGASAAMAFRPDGRWWDCTGIMRRGAPCSPDNVATVALLAQEQALKTRLDGFAAPPRRMSEAEVIALVGRQPQKIERVGPLVVLDWSGTTPGYEGEGKLSVTLGYEQFFEVKWIEPSRFFLWKRYEIQTPGAGRLRS